MEVSADIVQFRNFRNAVSKKTNENHSYVDLLDEYGELSLNCDAVEMAKVRMMRPYRMVATIQFRRIGMSQIAILKKLALIPAKFDEDEVGVDVASKVGKASKSSQKIEGGE